MAIDKVEFMTMDTITATPETLEQIELLKQVALHPEDFRLVFFHLPADLRLHAKHALINQWDPGEVRSVNTCEFITELIAAIHQGSGISSLTYYDDSPILLVDDLHLLMGKETTQEAFFSSVLKPRLEGKKLTILFSEYDYSCLSIGLRDDLRNLLRLGLHEPNK